MLYWLNHIFISITSIKLQKTCVLSSNMNYKFLIFAPKIWIRSQMHLKMMILSGYLSFYFSWGRHKILDYWTRWNKLLFYLELLSNKWLQAWMDEDRGQSHWVSIVGFSNVNLQEIIPQGKLKIFPFSKINRLIDDHLQTIYVKGNNFTDFYIIYLHMNSHLHSYFLLSVSLELIEMYSIFDLQYFESV